MVNPKVHIHIIPLAVQQGDYLGHYMEGGRINIFGQQDLKTFCSSSSGKQELSNITSLIFSFLTWYLTLTYPLGCHGILDLSAMKSCKLGAISNSFLIKSFLEDQEPSAVYICETRLKTFQIVLPKL